MKIAQLLPLLLLFPLAQAGAACNAKQAEELSDLVFAQPLAKTCASYLKPVNAELEPLPPYLKDQAKAGLRREKGGAIFEKIKRQIVPSSRAAAALEAWLNERIATGKLSHVSRPIKVFEIRQDKICEDQVAEKFAGMREKARTPEIRKDIEQAMESDRKSCLRRGYGYSNFVSREILLGDATLQRLGEAVSRFATLHELCHIQNPAIQSQSFEETFCDALALQWASPLMSKETLNKLRNDFSDQVAPENENEELLGLRSQLPVCCFNPL